MIGQSGGVANLFGNIPGKSSAIDVTANLQTKINTILREVDSGPAGASLGGGHFQNNATLFDCRQAWTGFTQNYLTDIRLSGGLKIAPAITADGKLRIAKANLTNQGSSRISVAACLVPFQGYTVEVANPANPLDPTQRAPAPTGVPCNAPPVGTVAALGVQPLGTPTGYTTTDNGSQVAVSAEITALSLPDVEVLVGGNQQ